MASNADESGTPPNPADGEPRGGDAPAGGASGRADGGAGGPSRGASAEGRGEPRSGGDAGGAAAPGEGVAAPVGAGGDVDPWGAEPHPAEIALQALAKALPDRINADPEKVEQGLARIVLTVVELLRRVLEHQAVRRMDGGSLTDEEIERLGLALLKLNERMQELKATFELTDEDLSIDLGPLGRLQ